MVDDDVGVELLIGEDRELGVLLLDQFSDVTADGGVGYENRRPRSAGSREEGGDPVVDRLLPLRIEIEVAFRSAFLDPAADLLLD